MSYIKSRKINVNINIFIEIELKVGSPIKTMYQINKNGKKLAGSEERYIMMKSLTESRNNPIWIFPFPKCDHDRVVKFFLKNEKYKNQKIILLKLNRQNYCINILKVLFIKFLKKNVWKQSYFQPKINTSRRTTAFFF